MACDLAKSMDAVADDAGERKYCDFLVLDRKPSLSRTGFLVGVLIEIGDTTVVEALVAINC